MKINKYIYSVNYQDYEKELCELEMRSLFNFDLEDKAFFSEKEINPSSSPFLKNRLEIIYKTSSVSEIIDLIIKDRIISYDYIVKYLELSVNDPYVKEGKKLSKEVGLRIQGFVCFSSPKNAFGISFYKDNWYFGELIESDSKWREHKNKPNSYSSSISINIAKALINIAGNGDLSKNIIDPCCGVGTVLLEGVISGYNIKGWELNNKIAEDARGNLNHFDYNTEVITGDIQDIDEHFDVSIVDLPYGIFSHADEDHRMMIIKNAKRISDKLVLVSSGDITGQILDLNLKILDFCKVRKSRKRNFARYIWVCE